MLHYLFDLLYVLPALIYAPVFFLKSRRVGEKAGLLFSERRGKIAPEKLKPLRGRRVIWIHAVSVGEVMVARRLIESLRAEIKSAPESELFHFLLTTVTPTGQKLARQVEAEDLTAVYVPFDFSFCVNSFLNQTQPEVLILVETEIWPNLILLTTQRRVPVMLVNARLSEKSLKNYRRCSLFLKPVLEKITRIFSQDEADAERFRQLEIPQNCVEVLGNIKFDAAEPQGGDAAFSRQNFALNSADKVWIAGSTHPGEESKVLAIFSKLRRKNPNLKLILAPRHIERASGIAAEMTKMKISFRHWGEINASLAWDVLLVDQLGVLKKIYGLGDFVFMGGSWIPHGGQNPIEPAVFNLPILHGPYVFNFKQVYEILDAVGAAFCVEDEAFCLQKLELFLNEPKKAAAYGRLAGETVGKYRGASARHARRVMECIKKG